MIVLSLPNGLSNHWTRRERGNKGGEGEKRRRGGKKIMILLSLPTGPFQPLDTEGEGE